MLKLLIPAALLLVACESVSGHAEQADFVIDAYEATYGDVPEDVAICVHEAPVTYPLRGAPNCCDGDFWCNGCTRATAAGVRIVIRRDLPPMSEVYTLRHEYTHALLWCMTRDMERDHQVPEFGFSDLVDAPGSLARYEP